MAAGRCRDLQLGAVGSTVVTHSAAADPGRSRQSPDPAGSPAMALRTLCVPLFNTCTKTSLLAIHLQDVGHAGSV